MSELRPPVDQTNGTFPKLSRLRVVMPRRRQPVLEDYQYYEQQTFIQDKEPPTDASAEPHEGLHATYPQEVVELVATNHANR